jgi:Domain of unknown function (DUF222)/HNH endonuclease
MGVCHGKPHRDRRSDHRAVWASECGRGELSYSKVRALTRIAKPENEEVLLMMALHGSAEHVEKLVRYYRRSQEAEELSREQRQQWHRSVYYDYLEDGSILIKARLPAETGRMLLKALDVAIEQMPRSESAERRVADGSPHPSVRRADALGVLAESFLAQGAEQLTGGDRQQIVVHIDQAVLEQKIAGRCEFEEGPSLAAETARRLACDASLIELIEDEKGEVLDIGRKSRAIPPAIRRALTARDRGCRFPGCHHERYVDGHHIQHWADGGQTKLSNLISLCRYHHRAVHEGGIAIHILDDGAFRFYRPEGSEIPRYPPWLGKYRPDYLDEIVIEPRAAATRFRAGDRMDYDLAVSGLCAIDERVSAETS